MEWINLSLDRMPTDTRRPMRHVKNKSVHNIYDLEKSAIVIYVQDGQKTLFPDDFKNWEWLSESPSPLQGVDVAAMEDWMLGNLNSDHNAFDAVRMYNEWLAASLPAGKPEENEL